MNYLHRLCERYCVRNLRKKPDWRYHAISWLEFKLRKLTRDMNQDWKKVVY